MNIAYLDREPWQRKRDCEFEGRQPAGAHGRAFVHGYADIPYHWHREMEILFVLRGSFRFVVDGQVCEMRQDDMIIINADVPHNSTAISREALICGVHLDVAHFERMGLPGFAARHYLCRTFLHSRSFMNRIAPIKALMARLALAQANQPEEIMIRQTIASLLACLIYRTVPHEKSAASAAQLRVDSRSRVIRIMNTLDESENGPQLSEIAEAEGLTLSHLSRLFKRHLGIGYRDYSQNLRLDSAAEDLRTTEDTIIVIVERHGFGNPAVFYNKFKGRFGCSPAEFRRNRRPLRPQSVLTEEDATEALKVLALHAGNVGKAAELAVGLNLTGRRQVTLNAPHNANLGWPH